MNPKEEGLVHEKPAEPEEKEPELKLKLNNLLGVPIKSKVSKAKYLLTNNSSEIGSVGSTRFSNFDYS